MTQTLRRGAVAFALGAMGVLAFAPYRVYPLIVALVAGLAHLGVSAISWRQAFAIGYGFGLGYFLFGVSWVYISMHDFGGMPMPVAAFATLLFCAYLALFPAAAGAMLGSQRFPAAVRLTLLFPALWALGEYLRGWFFTGFPWLAVGYSQVPAGPLGHYAPILGIYGVSWLTVLCGALLALWYSTRRERSYKAPLALFALLAGGVAANQIHWTQPVGAPTTVSLLQGNIEQSMKWRPEAARDTLDTYLRMTLSAKSKLIILPETALPMFNVDVPQEYFRLLSEHAKSQGGDVLIGVPEYVSRDQYFNSVMSFGTAPRQVYRKYHLVPFGDYFPRWPVLTWIMDALQIPMSAFARGETHQRPIETGGQKVAINICYEDVFGEEIIRQLPAATMLANFTNDAWWGDSKASDQHMQISQMRARETGRYMLRATNTGVTAIIDERGGVRAASPQFVETTLNGSVQGFSGMTPFSHWGNAAFLVLAGILFAVALFKRRAL